MLTLLGMRTPSRGGLGEPGLRPGVGRAGSEWVRSAAAPTVGPEPLHPSPEVPALGGQRGCIFLSFIPGRARRVC